MDLPCASTLVSRAVTLVSRKVTLVSRAARDLPCASTLPSNFVMAWPCASTLVPRALTLVSKAAIDLPCASTLPSNFMVARPCASTLVSKTPTFTSNAVTLVSTAVTLVPKAFMPSETIRRWFWSTQVARHARRLNKVLVHLIVDVLDVSPDLVAQSKAAQGQRSNSQYRHDCFQLKPRLHLCYVDHHHGRHMDHARCPLHL